MGMNKLSTTADDILDCAQRLIMAGGYNGFSYADIAAVVGIRKASIHHHFPSKADLVRTLILRYREQALAGLAAVERADPNAQQQLGHYLGYWQKCLSDGTAPICICALLSSELPVLPPSVAVQVQLHFASLTEWVTSVLQRGAQQGVFVLASPPAEAAAFVATVHGGMLSARVSGDPTLFGTITAALLRRLTH